MNDTIDDPDGGATPGLAHLRMPVDVRSTSLGVLAVLACVLALHLAGSVIVPLLLALMASYALNPVVDRLERLGLQRVLGATLLLMSIVAGTSWAVYSLSDDATALVESLPGAAEKVRQAVRSQRGASESALDKVQRAASQLQQAAQDGSAAPVVPPRGVTRVSIERSRFDLRDYFWTGTLGVLASLAQLVVVLFTTFFLLSSGSTFRRKMVSLAGPRFAEKRITVQVLDEITEQIRRYLLIQILTSALVGLVIWLAFLAVGVERAAVWGLVAFALNFVPFLGTIVLVTASAMVAFVQFGTLNHVLLVAGLALCIHTVAANVLAPWLASRTGRVNAVCVFVGVIAFGWLWGIWGLVLGVPCLTAIKAVCDRVQDLKPIGELLGN